MRRILSPACFLLRVLCWSIVVPASFAVAAIDEELTQQLKHLAPHEKISVIITMKDAIRPEDYRVRGRSQRNGSLVKALKQQARSSQPRIKSYLKRRKAKIHKELWIINGLAADVRADQVRELAMQPGVVNVRHDPVVKLNTHVATVNEGPSEWNLNVIKLPAGLTGEGVVVATMDTGVDIGHPYLAGKWRGGKNSWFDPHGQHREPYDADGHGTQVVGLIVGGNEGGIKIGVAPGAKYIAAKVFNDAGESTYSAIHSIFEWLLDPDDDPSTPDSPDVVNASWGLLLHNKCNTEFDRDIRLLKAAGIAVVFAAGNAGYAPATADSPASSAGTVSVGAAQYSLFRTGLYDVASFSSRGPSPCGGGTFPTLLAPGEAIKTYDLSTGGTATYTTVSGSSFATPHVSGVLALLVGAFPGVSVVDLEKAITPGLGTPDNNFGYGLLDAYAAFQTLASRPGGTPAITSVPEIVASQNAVYTYQVAAKDADADILTYTLDASPSGMNISETGLITWVPTIDYAGQQLVTVRVADTTGLYSTQAYTLVVANAADAPVAIDDSYEMPQGETFSIPYKGVLWNDTDPKKNQLFAVDYSVASTGVLSAKRDGSFVYTPPSPEFTGIVTFNYQADNALLKSVPATVTIKVRARTPVPSNLPPSFPINVVPRPPTGFFQDAPIQEVALKEKNDKGEEAVKLEGDEPKPESARGEGSAPKFTSIPSTAAKQGAAYYYQASVSDQDEDELVFALDTAPEGMTISKYGEISWIPNSAQVGSHLIVLRVTDADKLFATQSYKLVVENVNDAPVAVSDSFTLLQGSTFTVVAPGVLKNDIDADMTPLKVVSYSSPSKGTMTGKPDGSFVYMPPTADFLGSANFTYRVSDGELMSEAAKVTIDVISNRPPLARDDTVNVKKRSLGVAYRAIPVYVLNNDGDPDSEFDRENKIAPETLKVVNPPNNRGQVEISKGGVIKYTPTINFTGVETFTYNVGDTRKAVSNTVTVRINVK